MTRHLWTESRSVAGRDGQVRKAVAIALPLAVPAGMTGVFRLTRRLLGDRVGYVAGFAVYWSTCAGLSLALLGPRRVRQLVRDDQHDRLRSPTAIALLVWPPAGGIATRFIPEVATATPRDVATIVSVASANAVLEELLWRGVYVTLWPRNPVLGWVWPAIGFGLWHRAPQVIHPSEMGRGPYVVAATALGLSWGWVAWRTGSLRAVAFSHVVTDGSGIRNARFFVAS
jgi:membrane protease YdiL (CAAX protease family)